MRRTVLGGGFGLAWFLAWLPNVENGKGKRVVEVSQSLPTSPHGEFFQDTLVFFYILTPGRFLFLGIQTDCLNRLVG